MKYEISYKKLADRLLLCIVNFINFYYQFLT